MRGPIPGKQKWALACLPVILVSLFLGPFLNGCNPKGSPGDSVNILITKSGLKVMVVALEGYREEYREYPEILDQILIRKNITEREVIQDAWGRDYRYVKIADGYVLFSLGRDGKPFTDDDIYPVTSPNP
jgi:hypothetical protein